MDLIGMAAYTHKEYISGGIQRTLERGDIGNSERGLAQRWQWSKTKVRNFLQELQDAAAIEVIPVYKGSIIRIINYDFYQSTKTTEKTTEKTTKKTAVLFENSTQNANGMTTKKTTEKTTEKTITNKYIKKLKESIYIANAAEIGLLRENFKGDVDELIDAYVDWRANHPEVVIHNDMAKIRDFARRQQRSRAPRGKAKTIDEIANEVLGGTT